MEFTNTNEIESVENSPGERAETDPSAGLWAEAYGAFEQSDDSGGRNTTRHHRQFEKPSLADRMAELGGKLPDLDKEFSGFSFHKQQNSSLYNILGPTFSETLTMPDGQSLSAHTSMYGARTPTFTLNDGVVARLETAGKDMDGTKHSPELHIHDGDQSINLTLNAKTKAANAYVFENGLEAKLSADGLVTLSYPNGTRVTLSDKGILAVSWQEAGGMVKSHNVQGDKDLFESMIGKGLNK